MDSRRRSLAKAISWRVIAACITASVGYVMTDSVAFGATLGIVDSVVKIFIYYAHERGWNRLRPSDAGSKSVPLEGGETP
jgi:uncharacterized membrane protein